MSKVIKDLWGVEVTDQEERIFDLWCRNNDIAPNTQKMEQNIKMLKKWIAENRENIKVEYFEGVEISTYKYAEFLQWFNKKSNGEVREKVKIIKEYGGAEGVLRKYLGI